MSNYKNQVLELVKQRPGVRVFQISDLLDLDVDIVEGILAQAVREEVIHVDVVPGPNRLPTKTYSFAGVTSREQVKPKIDIVIEPESYLATHTAPVAETAPAAPLAPPAQAAPPRTAMEAIATAAVSTTIRVEGFSKAALALDHLKKNGATDRATLVEVMGLVKKYQVEQYLKSYLKSGRIVRIDEIYCIPDRTEPSQAATAIVVDKPAAMAPVPTDSAPVVAVADPVHSPSHYTSGGIEVIDVLRAKLTPEEFRGFLKGNVIKYMLRAEHKGGAKDYKKGCKYATWLAEQATAQAA